MKPDEIETQEDFALGLMRLRSFSGLTREQIREMVLDAGGDISVSSITGMCSGDFFPRPYYLRVFLQALGVEGDELDSWLRARDRLWAAQRARKRKPSPVDPPTGVEGELLLIRQQLSRVEGMLLALAREWGIGKRDV